MSKKALKDRRGFLFSLPVLALSLSVLVPAARAEDAASGTTKLQAVEVTGSRIKKSESTGTSPVLTITAQDLAATGLASIGDVLQQLSVTGSSLNTKFNSAGNFGFPANGGGVGSGSTTVSLRNLGAQRTLVLVDGLRWINESSASGVSGAVDLNTIPLGAVDRIEILADGASALYGSDAIGGVINIITKKSQEGAALHAYYGNHEVGSGNTWSGDLSFGGKTDKSRYFIDVGHFYQGSISSSAWAQSAFPVPGTGVALGSSATPNGRLVFNTDANNTFGGLCPSTNGTATCDITPNGPASPQTFPSGYHAFSDADRFNYATYNFLLTPQRRTSIFGQGVYDVADNVHLNVKGAYTARTSVNQAAPEPIFLGPGAGTGGLADTVTIDSSNPYFPTAMPSDAFDASHELLVTRRPVEGGPRIYSQDVNTRYISVGLNGELSFLQRDFNWDVNYAGATNDASQLVTGTYNIRHIQTALGPVANCTAPCVPLNIFGGPGSITPDMLGYILYNEHDTSTQSLELATANISGGILDLPAGSLDFAAGYEHRRYQGSYSPDQIVIQGDSNGVPSQPTAGSYTVNEYYGELAVPLLKDLPLAKTLDLSLATRYSSYVPFGGTTKSKLGLRWEPYQDLTLRVNYAGGFRAPTIGEAYGTSARFDATLNDPCDMASTATTIQNCKNLGVPNPQTFNQANTQISTQTGGNQKLKPETSHNFTVGGVYSPSWAENKSWSSRMDFEVTYYRIQMRNAIAPPDAQTKLDRCVASGDPNSSFCQGITRSSTGDINQFTDFLTNLGTLDTNGIDIAWNWTLPRFAFGRFSTNWKTTFTGKFQKVDSDTGLAEPDAVGREVNDSGIPRWKSTLRLNWELDPFSATWAVRYLSALREDCANAAGLPVCPDAPSTSFPDGSNRLDQVFYDDVQFTYKLPPRLLKATVSAGINNVFDQGAPDCLSCSLNGYDASNYDLPGRFMYVETTVKF